MGWSTKAKRARRPQRRPSDEIRTLVLDAARELFTTQGYGATTTKQIAAKAGTVETALFRNFGSKAALFVAAVVSPFSEYIASYVTSWENHPATTSAEELVEDFVAGFFDLARGNRALLSSLIAARMSGESSLDAVANEVTKLFSTALAAMYRVAVEEGRARQFEGMDPPATIAAVVSMVLGMTLLDDWVFPPGRRPGRDRQVQEITTMILHGIAHRSAGRGRGIVE